MFEILKKRVLSSQVTLMDIHAPFVAAKAEPGQFIILRVDENGERIPLTIASFDREQGIVTIIFQLIGKTTMQLSLLNEGDALHDFVGPLGKPSHLDGFKKVCVVGGGLGCAIAYPQAKKLFSLDAKVDLIAGFKTADLVFFEDEMKAVSNNFYLCTDDGTAGQQALVTNVLEKLITDGNEYDLVIAIGPLIMMKFVTQLTKKYNIPTIVSMNTVMIDGTGMCGGCRLTVGGETRFACVDGPEFDGHLVDFDEAMKRSSAYKKQETSSVNSHLCNLKNMEVDE